jgi:hypothetical protein
MDRAVLIGVVFLIAWGISAFTQDSYDKGGSTASAEHQGYTASAPARALSSSTASTPFHSEQLDGMTKAASDAGYDDATAHQLGREATALCNGNPECLK